MEASTVFLRAPNAPNFLWAQAVNRLRHRCADVIVPLLYATLHWLLPRARRPEWGLGVRTGWGAYCRPKVLNISQAGQAVHQSSSSVGPMRRSYQWATTQGVCAFGLGFLSAKKSNIHDWIFTVLMSLDSLVSMICVRDWFRNYIFLRLVKLRSTEISVAPGFHVYAELLAGLNEKF